MKLICFKENTFIQYYADNPKHIILENGLPDDIADFMQEVLDTYLPMNSFIGSDTRNIDKSVRDSEVRFVQFNERTQFLKDWLIETADKDKFWFPRESTDRFERTSSKLEGLNPEPVQVTTYRNNNYYDWHVDGRIGDPRCLTLIAQLSDSAEYEGGKLEVEGIDFPDYAYQKGSVILLYPHLRHRVTAITKGVRHSMITWFRDEFKQS